MHIYIQVSESRIYIYLFILNFDYEIFVLKDEEGDDSLSKVTAGPAPIALAVSPAFKPLGPPPSSHLKILPITLKRLSRNHP